jgi:uncharacterized protein GlcG (DUF336 family)
MHRFALSAIATAFALAPFPASAEDAMVVQVKRLSLGMAVQVAQGALDACREKGIQVGVTVVDRNGIEQVILRDTIAPPITASISKTKAFTAANFNAATADLKRVADTPIGRVPGLVMEAGGVPIEVGGALLGAVGVSGAPDSAVDAECALAGVAAVMDDLELGM